MPWGRTGPGFTNPGGHVPMKGSTSETGSAAGGAACTAGSAAATRPIATATVPGHRLMSRCLQRAGAVEEGLRDVVAEATVEGEDLLVLAGLRPVLGDDVALGVELEALD